MCEKSASLAAARAASGHAAAPPSSAMNSRRNFLRQKSNTY
jgi:hypothetical protein